MRYLIVVLVSFAAFAGNVSADCKILVTAGKPAASPNPVITGCVTTIKYDIALTCDEANNEHPATVALRQSYVLQILDADGQFVSVKHPDGYRTQRLGAGRNGVVVSTATATTGTTLQLELQVRYDKPGAKQVELDASVTARTPEGLKVFSSLDNVIKLTAAFPTVQLASADFLGKDNHQLRKDGKDDWSNDKFGAAGNVVIDYPEWADSDLDGAPEVDEPICYNTAGTYVVALDLHSDLCTEGKIKATLRVKNLGTLVTRKDFVLAGADMKLRDVSFTEITTGDEVFNGKVPFDFEVSFDGVTFNSIGRINSQEFIVLKPPIKRSTSGETNPLTCKRANEVTVQAKSLSNVDRIAEKILTWADLQPSAKAATADTLDKRWGMADKDFDGQCAQTALLMEHGVNLLGIEAEYQHVFASQKLPVTLHTYAKPAEPETRVLNGATEKLSLFFSLGAGNPLDGFNYGEGCCLVNGRLYAALTGGLVGEQGKITNGVAAQSPAHSVLLLLEAGIMKQKWHPSGELVPVPK